MENETITCPFCGSSNVKYLESESKHLYKCESCSNHFGLKGGPRDETPD